MATLISPDPRFGSGRRLLATFLCVLLVLSSILPGVAFAGETDSEGEGTAQPVEAPIPPGFDPGGEETALEEAPAPEGAEEEGGAVEVEPEVDTEVPATNEVTSAAVEGTVEEPPSQPVEVQPLPAAPEPEAVEQEASESAPSEPVANESLVAPKQSPVRQSTSHEQPAPAETSPPPEPTEEAPNPGRPTPATLVGSGGNLQGKNSYVVRPGDCLWRIAAALLPAGADTAAIEAEVARLWRLNEDRIGTGDPGLIYAGTTLRLH